jgi:hydroxylamine reductase (hybrid-cluster protein)
MGLYTNEYANCSRRYRSGGSGSGFSPDFKKIVLSGMSPAFGSGVWKQLFGGLIMKKFLTMVFMAAIAFTLVAAPVVRAEDAKAEEKKEEKVEKVKKKKGHKHKKRIKNAAEAPATGAEGAK